MEFNFYHDSRDNIDVECNDGIDITDSHNNISGGESCSFDVNQYESSIKDSISVFDDKNRYDINPNDPSKIDLVLFSRRFDVYY